MAAAAISPAVTKIINLRVVLNCFPTLKTSQNIPANVLRIDEGNIGKDRDDEFVQNLEGRCGQFDPKFRKGWPVLHRQRSKLLHSPVEFTERPP